MFDHYNALMLTGEEISPEKKRMLEMINMVEKS